MLHREPINYAKLSPPLALTWAAMTHLDDHVRDWAVTLPQYDSILRMAQQIIIQQHPAEHPRIFSSFIAYAYQKFMGAKGSRR